MEDRSIKPVLPDNPINGRHGQRWPVVMPSAADLERNPAVAATLAMFVMYIPEAVAAWSWYGCSVIHLRDIPGTKPPRIDFEGATHEILILALDPREGTPDPFQPGGFKYLLPINVEAQCKLDTDEQALRLLEMISQNCIDGQMPVEPDGIIGANKFWVEAIRATADHLRQGFCDAEVVDVGEVG